MRTITREYANPNNGGRERVTRDGETFVVSSDWGYWFCRGQQVSRGQAETCMNYTGAPKEVVAAILAAA